MDWSACVSEIFDYIPERYLTNKARWNLVKCFISNPDFSVIKLHVHPTTGIADIVCPNEEALELVKSKIRWFVTNNIFYNFLLWSNKLKRINDTQLTDEIKSIAVFPVNVLRVKETYDFLETLFDVDAVDAVYIRCYEDDILVTIFVKTVSDASVNECSLKIQDYLNHSPLNSPATESLQSSTYSFLEPNYILPVPCGSKIVLEDSGLLGGLCDEFDDIHALYFDEKDSTLTISAPSDVTTLVIFRVLGRLSMNKKTPGARSYRVFTNRLYREINVCSVTGEATIFLSDTHPASMRVDFTDYPYDGIKTFWSNMPDSSNTARISERKFDFYASRNNVCENLRGRIDRGFLLFLDWDILPTLTNVEVSFRLGGVSICTNKYSPKEYNLDDNIAIFSPDLKIPHDALIKILTDRGFTEKFSSFVSLSFFDLSSNARYSATFPTSSLGTANEDFSITKRRAKHVNNILMTNSCSIIYQNIISSRLAFPKEKLVMLKDFAKESYQDYLSGSDGMYYNNLFCLFNASNVQRYTFTKDMFKAEIDVISKKTYQRNGGSDTVTRFTVTCPDLNSNIQQLQNCSVSQTESLKQNVRSCHEKLVDFAEEICGIVDVQTAFLTT